VAAVVVVALVAAAPAVAGFGAAGPDDPDYDSGGCTEQQYHLFAFIPEACPLVSAQREPDGASGMSVNEAWEQFTTGNADTVIAYVEAGINWHGEEIEELANRVFLNAGELPAPTTPDGDPALRASDFADTPDRNDNGLVDPEDLIVRFSDGADDDGNGFTDDISGWDFYTDTNDPATIDGAYEHANSQEKQAGAETDNGVGRAGVCPDCRILPVKAGAEALDRTDELAQAWLYAARMKASVIVSVTADLGYSTFMRRTAEQLNRRGVSVVQASNDFNSTDHQGGMFHPHVLGGNGVVADRAGFPDPVSQGTTTTFRQRSSITSWGTHGDFSVPTVGGTTSSSTPTLGGVLALVLAYGREAAAAGLIDRPLTGPEAEQVLRATASDIDDPALAWPSRPGWDLQYGYGRPHAVRAMQAIRDDEIPPLAAIDTPDWYELHDPTRSGTVAVAGRIDAGRSRGYRYELELGVGGEPGDDEFVTVGRGSGGSEAFDGPLGEVDLSTIPRAVWSRAFELSERKELETTERYTATLRLRVRDADGRIGEDRRSFFVHRDESWVDGFPKRIGPGGESQPALADLQGRGRLAIVFADTDGVVHAIDGRTAEELPGWPRRTDATRTAADDGIDAGHEPVVSNVAVGDLDGTGELSVVATSTTGRVYAWHSDGSRREGWPQVLDTQTETPPIPRPERPYSRHPTRGAFAAPVLGDLDADGRLEVVQAAWDGHLHVFGADGRERPGWPVKVKLPDSYRPAPGQFLVRDEKLSGTPVLADLDGDKRLEIVQRSQYTDISEGEFAPGAVGHLHAYRADGAPVPGWPVDMRGIVEAYGTAQEFITEGANSPVAADVDGDGDDEIASNPVLSQSYLFDGAGGQPRRVYGPVPDATAGLLNQTAVSPAQIAAGNMPVDTPVGFTTTGAFGRFAGGLSFVQPGSGAASIGATLALPGLGNPIKNYERAFDAATGVPRPGFPASMQGLNFLGAPLLVDVTGDGEAEVVDGGDSSALHGFRAGGTQAEGFPKFTTGWTLWSPAAGDLDGDGKTELVAMTREGYLFAWRTEGRADANTEWWRWHHDEWSTGRYGTDARPPGVVREARAEPGSVSVLLPGDDWYMGRARELRVTYRGAAAARGAQAPSAQSGATVPASGAAGTRQEIEVPEGTRRVSVQAVDDAGNLGRAVTVELPGAEAAEAAPAQVTPVSGPGTPREAEPAAPRPRREAGSGGGSLPFTGLELAGLAALGAGLALSGGALRRRLSASRSSS